MHKAFDQSFLRAFNKHLREASHQAARNASALKRRPRLESNDNHAHVHADDEGHQQDSAATYKYLEQRERRRSRGRKILHPTLEGYTPLLPRAARSDT